MCKGKDRKCDCRCDPGHETLYITQSGTYRIPPEAQNVKVTLWGGGGGGGGGSIFAIPDQFSGGGGGAGGYAVENYRVRSARTFNVVIGDGGEGGRGQTLISGSTSGSDGEPTVVTFGGTSVEAGGGAGGKRGFVNAGVLTEEGTGGVNPSFPIPYPLSGISYKCGNGGNGRSTVTEGSNGDDFVSVSCSKKKIHNYGGKITEVGGGGGAGYNGDGANSGNDAVRHTGAGGGGGNTSDDGGDGGSGGVIITYTLPFPIYPVYPVYPIFPVYPVFY